MFVEPHPLMRSWDLAIPISSCKIRGHEVHVNFHRGDDDDDDDDGDGYASSLSGNYNCPN